MTDVECGRDERCLPREVAIELVGEGASWFDIERCGDGILIRPTHALPRRCMLRAAALFRRGRGFPDVNTVMGHLLFARGATEQQAYRPFTLDPDRTLQALYLLTEPTPDDDLFASVGRWRNYETVAKRLLAAAGVPWDGLTDAEIDDLVGGEPWHQPLDGCVLHALTQWTCALGYCVIEIGSLRGQSLAMLGRAMEAAHSESMLISIDPHTDCPEHQAYTRLALSRMGCDRRLVQFPCRSDDAWRMIRPGCASLVFVDGDHSYDHVVADFRNYRDLLAPCGCIVFHDYGYGDHNGQPDVVPDVRPAIDDHVVSAEGFRPLLLAHTLLAFVKMDS